MTKNAIEIYNLTKKFGDFTAVDNLSLNVKEGEIFGFLGPNGQVKAPQSGYFVPLPSLPPVLQKSPVLTW